MSVLAFLDAPATAAAHAASVLAQLLHPAFGAASTAAVIVVFTALVRLALHPLARAQVRGEKLRARLAPQLKELAKRHRKDPAKLRAAQAELYRSEHISPLAGCLPSLLMWPVFAVLYRLFSLPTLDGHTNTLLTNTLAGVPLSAHALTALPSQLPVFVTLFALLAIASTAAFRRARRTVDATTAGASFLPYLSFGTILFAVFVPLSASLYLLTTTTWTIVERTLLRA
jgi:YidC/Oxa1 family membrane protein insertase